MLLVAALFILLLLSLRKRRLQHRRRIRARTASRHQKFPREKLEGHVVRIGDGDNLIAVLSGFGRMNIRLAHFDAPELDQPGGAEPKKELTELLGDEKAHFRLLYSNQHDRPVAVV